MTHTATAPATSSLFTAGDAEILALIPLQIAANKTKGVTKGAGGGGWG